jgi:cyclase
VTHFRLEQVADGAWAAIADSDLAVGNAGIVDLGGEMLVFDTSWTPAAARELAGFGPVRWVVNSHWIAGPGQERLAGLQQELETSDDAPP